MALVANTPLWWSLYYLCIIINQKICSDTKTTFDKISLDNGSGGIIDLIFFLNRPWGLAVSKIPFGYTIQNMSLEFC